jgi:hypothetical protein
MSRTSYIFFLICIMGGWNPNWVHSARRPLTGLLYLPRVIVRMEHLVEWQRKPKYSEKTCPDATLSTTNPTWPDSGLNPGRRGGKPATNRLSYGAAEQATYSNTGTLLAAQTLFSWQTGNFELITLKSAMEENVKQLLPISTLSSFNTLYIYIYIHTDI